MFRFLVSKRNRYTEYRVALQEEKIPFRLQHKAYEMSSKLDLASFLSHSAFLFSTE